MSGLGPTELCLSGVDRTPPKKLARPLARGPLLSLGAGVVVDCRFLDRIELAGRFADASPMRLLMSIGEVEVGVEYPGTSSEAEALIVELARYTRAAPIRSEEQYDEDAALLHAVLTGSYEQPPVLVIDGEIVSADSGLVSTGMVGYVIEEVESAAARGLSVELITGDHVPAAILLLAIAAAEPPAIENLEQRLIEYREVCRRPAAPS